jgi:hypothetical protein
MKDKQEYIEQTSAQILKGVQALVDISPDQIRDAMRRCMDEKQLQMYDLALFCEGEMLKARETNANLAACLMGAAMSEALLALMCLKYEGDVINTNQYGYSTRKKQHRTFRDVIGDWKFEQFICVAEELDWIPSGIVDENCKLALSEGFRELMPITHPEMTAEQINLGANSFHTHPSTAMLRMTQTLRNAIHAGRWMRGKSSFVPEHFTQWCRFSTLLSGEIRMCLLIRITERDSVVLAKQMQELSKMLETLPPKYQSLFEQEIKTRLGIEAKS